MIFAFVESSGLVSFLAEAGALFIQILGPYLIWMVSGDCESCTRLLVPIFFDILMSYDRRSKEVLNCLDIFFLESRNPSPRYYSGGILSSMT